VPTNNPLILFVGDLNFFAKGASRINAMEQLGATVIGLPHTPLGGDKTGTSDISLYFRIAWKLGIHLDTENVNRKILDVTRLKNPDLLWIEKGNMISPSTLKAVHEISPNTKICAYSDDDMFHTINHTRAYVKSLPHYDMVFVTKSYNANTNELPALGAKRCITIDKAYDPAQHMPLELNSAERSALACDVSFIGSYAQERGEVLNFLAESGVSVVAWGNGWKGFKPVNRNLVITKKPLVNTPNNLRFTKGINAAKINLAFLRKINRDLQTDRSIEIPACGGFMLAERSVEHELLFEDKKEAVYFGNETELLKKIRYYLEHNQERTQIAKAGYERTRRDGYSHKDRMKKMLESMLT
jgi:spore maturation protein CgeB